MEARNTMDGAQDSKARRAIIADRHRKRSGQRAEEAALAHLQAAGLRLLLRNYRCKAGEIDLVLMDGPVLVLTEVRYRASSSYGGPAASVTWRKQRRLTRTARHLLMTRPELRRHPLRFDVVAIGASSASSRGGAATQPACAIDWIRNAFIA